ncbi:LLM class flavin-dependent oxidoreductase [Gordonia sp. HNM0687]|uniref:LLM class flavin-dependent oxidoreductase n=1 Tax=Gordonia mangrovi TaxID=2665643 RepID=A0A6L7GWV3_9ACTN|nr:LLM class flavin-dependent oxidoreductase [Gordonia mangrovi]MXP23501.1 LLM class flavin-dependent oxidoreductase [Gordonia mangrovi]UVF76605.1 LLM class flavin-dependent oxidoreductase [Gordonia mangrovi]
MRVGLYFDLRNPPQWQTDPQRLYSFTLELCEEADRLGIDSLWFTEHHKFDDGYLSQPLTLAAAAAARTKQARIGTGIVVAPLHHPAELAEQAAIVDLISGGRLDLGIGAGYRHPEFELYGAEHKKRYGTTDARVGELRDLWSTGGVTPGPVQQPIPIWMGYLGPKGAARAGRLGASLLTPNAEMWPHYRAALSEAGHPIELAQMGGGIQGWATEDPDKDWPTVSKHLAYQLDSYRRHMVQGTDAPIPRPVDPERVAGRHPRASLDYFFYGTPESVADRVRAYSDGAPVDTVYFWASLGGMPEEMVRRNVTLICERMRPLLADAPAEDT